MKPTTLYVSTEGSDEFSGSMPRVDTQCTDGPLASLKGSRDRLRALRADGALRGPAEVVIAGGTYLLTETLRFEQRDLGDAGTPVVFRGADNEEVTLTGAVELTGFQPSAREGIFELDLAKAGYRGLRFNQLYFNGAAQTLARYPSFDPENPRLGGYLYREGRLGAGHFQKKGKGQADRFVCPDGRPERWGRIDEVQLCVFPRFNWRFDTRRLKGFDPHTREVTLAEPCTFDIYPGDRFFFQNIREELTEPGEWYLDRDSEKLYFYPPSPLEQGIVRVPVTASLITIEAAAPKLPTRRAPRSLDGHYGRGYLTFSNLRLEGCTGDGVRMEHVRSCSLIKSSVRATGGDGVVIRDGLACEVVGCDIADTGGKGLDISGGISCPFTGSWTSCKHRIENNHIHHPGRIARDAAALSARGVGVLIRHNLIHDSPRIGIFFRGNDHRIEFNRVHRVMLETDDGSAIGSNTRDFTMRGSKIRYNHLSGVTGIARDPDTDRWDFPRGEYTWGVFLDDFTSGTEVGHNLLEGPFTAGISVHAGCDNVLENNILIVPEGQAFRHEDQGRFWRELLFVGTHQNTQINNTIRRNILVLGEKACVYFFGFRPLVPHWPSAAGETALEGDGAPRIPDVLSHEGTQRRSREVPGEEIDFQHLFGCHSSEGYRRIHAVTHAYRVLESSGEQILRWPLALEKGGVVWLNGREVFNSLDGRYDELSPSAACPLDLHLRKGTNTVAVRCQSGYVHWRLTGYVPIGEGAFRWAGPWIVFDPVYYDVPMDDEWTEGMQPKYFPAVQEAMGRCRSNFNLIHCDGDNPPIVYNWKHRMSFSGWRAMGFDPDSITADPRFADASSGDYRFGRESPAWKLGITPLPLERVGLYDDPRRFTPPSDDWYAEQGPRRC